MASHTASGHLQRDITLGVAHLVETLQGTVRDGWTVAPQLILDKPHCLLLNSSTQHCAVIREENELGVCRKPPEYLSGALHL